MSVYFIQASGGEIKIGYAKDIARRLSALQTSHPGTLRVVRREHGGADREKFYHDMFSHLRIRGEWFACKGTLAEFLGIDPNVSTVESPLCKNCGKRAIAVGRFCAVCTIWSVLMPDRAAYGFAEIKEKHRQFKAVAGIVGFEIPSEMAL